MEILTPHMIFVIVKDNFEAAFDSVYFLIQAHFEKCLQHHLWLKKMYQYQQGAHTQNNLWISIAKAEFFKRFFIYDAELGIN